MIQAYNQQNIKKSQLFITNAINAKVIQQFGLYFRSWDKVYVVLHANTLSCYKDKKVAKQVSLF